jgi:hypothetical protein
MIWRSIPAMLMPRTAPAADDLALAAAAGRDSQIEIRPAVDAATAGHRLQQRQQLDAPDVQTEVVGGGTPGLGLCSA